MNAHVAPFDRLHEDTVSPTAKSTDLAKASLPIAWVAGIVLTLCGFGVTQALSMAAMRSDVRDILTRMEYEAKMRETDARLLEARFSALDAQITSAGLRNSALNMAQKLDQQNRK
ncbi:MAG: hypothetical protein ACKVQA_07055 [Burkholderiales bacterium]